MKKWEKPKIQDLKLCNTMQYDIETHDFLDGLCYCNQNPASNWKNKWGWIDYECGHKYHRLNDGGKCPNDGRIWDIYIGEGLTKCS